MMSETYFEIIHWQQEELDMCPYVDLINKLWTWITGLWEFTILFSLLFIQKFKVFNSKVLKMLLKTPRFKWL